MEAATSNYQLYPQRFLVALAVFCGNFNNAIIWSTYASVTPSTSEHYGVDEWSINELVLYFDVCFFPLCGLALWVLDTKGVRPSILTGVWFTVGGAFLRWAAKFSSSPMQYVIAGTIMAALVNPFTLDSPTKAAAVWFGETERLTANTVMSLATFLGSALVLFVAPMIVQENPDNVDDLNWATFLVMLLLAIPSLFIQNEPPTPPTKDAHEIPIPFWEGVKKLACNSQYILLFWIAGLSMGCFEVYITLISDSIVPYGYTESDAGTLGLISILSGIAASLALARTLDHWKVHRAAIKILPFFTVLGSLGFYFCALHTDRRIFLYISASIIGLGCFPVLPIALEVGSECARPVAEGTSGGILETSIQFCAIFILLICDWLRDVDGKLGNALVWFAVVFSIVAFLTVFVEGDEGTLEERQRLLEEDEETP